MLSYICCDPVKSIELGEGLCLGIEERIDLENYDRSEVLCRIYHKNKQFNIASTEGETREFVKLLRFLNDVGIKGNECYLYKHNRAVALKVFKSTDGITFTSSVGATTIKDIATILRILQREADRIDGNHRSIKPVQADIKAQILKPPNVIR
jgi:hypothetical protein